MRSKMLKSGTSSETIKAVPKVPCNCVFRELCVMCDGCAVLDIEACRGETRVVCNRVMVVVH